MSEINPHASNTSTISQEVDRLVAMAQRVAGVVPRTQLTEMLDPVNALRVKQIRHMTAQLDSLSEVWDEQKTDDTNPFSLLRSSTTSPEVLVRLAHIHQVIDVDWIHGNVMLSIPAARSAQILLVDRLVEVGEVCAVLHEIYRTEEDVKRLLYATAIYENQHCTLISYRPSSMGQFAMFTISPIAGTSRDDWIDVRADHLRDFCL